jgi:cyclopropane fatty-acyl-phospholipid synthase-like methyltransferase
VVLPAEMLLPYFEIVISLAENLPYIIALTVGTLAVAQKKYRCCVLLTPLLVIAGIIACVVLESRYKIAADWASYEAAKPSLRSALEGYITTGKGDLNSILENDAFDPIFGPEELQRFLKTWLPGVLSHNKGSDNEMDVPVAYNKGDDWFEATLGEPMIYTGAIYRPGMNDSITKAQNNKLRYILDSMDVQKGDNVLDIGCGWGRLLQWYADHGAKATGITLSTDQKAYGERLNKKHGANVQIKLENFMTVDLPKKGFKAISSVEMAEHVGIRHYTSFLRKVHELLADDGTLYFQVAGLRRGYGTYHAIEELVWGLFMDEHVFPGAEASCPAGWVTTQLERAGFEVQRMQNLGWHYSQTLAHWLVEWDKKEKSITATYGAMAFRRWRVFLAWSVRIARRGGSSVFFIVATKAGQEKARIAAQDRLVKQLDFDSENGIRQ